MSTVCKSPVFYILNWLLVCDDFLGSFLVGVALGWTYHYSNKTMNWQKARQWCQTSYTDMLVIQNQEENNYVVSILPNKTKSPYYWIGITRKHKDEDWTWIGNNSTWVGEHSWAESEPNNDENTEFCVEIYVNGGHNRGKWNDEKCSQAKYAVCYKGKCARLFFWHSREVELAHLRFYPPLPPRQPSVTLLRAREAAAGRPSTTPPVSVTLALWETGAT